MWEYEYECECECVRVISVSMSGSVSECEQCERECECECEWVSENVRIRGSHSLWWQRWGCSSNGRAPALHAGGTGIDTLLLHSFWSSACWLVYLFLLPQKSGKSKYIQRKTWRDRGWWSCFLRLRIIYAMFTSLVLRNTKWYREGGLAQMVERLLSMQEAQGSIPWSSTPFSFGFVWALVKTRQPVIM